MSNPYFDDILWNISHPTPEWTWTYPIGRETEFGWVCPRCNRVLSPTTCQCEKCNEPSPLSRVPLKYDMTKAE